MSLHQPGAASIAAATDPPRLSQVLGRLEEIRHELDRDDLDLEDQLALYREGCGHVITAKRILGDVRSEVEILTQEADAVETRGAEV
jgi:exodeoxyribonuclease VII small subunit